MSLDFVNIATIFAAAITAVFIIHTIYEAHKENKQKRKLTSQMKEEMTDYDKILQATYGLENAREKNKGVHLDEEVYLNRANEIRKASPLFKWINE